MKEIKHGYYYINQKDPKWQKYKYAGKNPKENACGPFVLAMALSNIFKKEVSPINLMKFAEENYYEEEGTSWSFFEEYLKKYKIKVKEILPSEKEFLDAMEKNKLVIFSQNNKLNNYWTTSGHYILVVKQRYIDNGKEEKIKKYIVLDPASRRKTNKMYFFEEIFIPCKRMWILDI